MGVNSELEPQLFSRSNAAIGNALEDIDVPLNSSQPAEIILRSGFTKISMEVKNTGAAALTDFALLVKAHETGDWVSAVADWTAVGDILKFKSANVNTLGAGLTALLLLDMGGSPYAIKFQGRCGTTTSAVARGSLFR